MRKLWFIGAFAAGALLVVTPQAQAKAYSEKDLTVPHEGPVQALTNGKTAFYTSYSLKDGSPVLCKYRIGAEGPTQVKKLKWLADSNGDEMYRWSVANVRKGKVYLNWGAEDRGFKGIYRVRASGGKLKKIKSRANVHVAYGSNKYVAVTARAHSDVSAEDYTLYKIADGKLKKLKRIASHGFSLTVVGKRLYFTRSTDDSLSVTRLYRCDFNGKHVKKLGGPWRGAKNSWGYRGQAIASNITGKRCVVTIQNKRGDYVRHTYVYKTKKLSRK